MRDDTYLYYSFSENDNFGKIIIYDTETNEEEEFLYNEQYEKWLPYREPS